HHQVPTRLIDVSMKPLEALYFAVEKEDGVDGRLFVVAPHCGTDELPNSKEPLELSQGQGNVAEGKSPLPWVDAVRGVQQAHGEWSNEVRLVDEEPLDPRMRAQAGKFLVGGLHRAYRGLNMPGVDKDVRPKISNLAINFNPPFGNGQISKEWRATGWSVRIYAEWKSELRNKLAGLQGTHGIENISEDSMYPPIGQIGRLGKHVAETGMEAAIAAALRGFASHWMLCGDVAAFPRATPSFRSLPPRTDPWIARVVEGRIRLRPPSGSLPAASPRRAAAPRP